MLLRDVRRVTAELAERRDRSFAATVRCLAAATEAGAARGNVELADLAKRHNVDAELLTARLNYVGVGTGGHVQIENYFTNQLSNVSGYAFAKGWEVTKRP